MADVYSNLELVNNAVQEAGAGDKRNRNNAIRKGLENPGLYSSTFGNQATSSQTGVQPTTPGSVSLPAWLAPESWGKFGYDKQESSKVWHEHQRQNILAYPDQYDPDTFAELSKPIDWASKNITNNSLEDFQKTAQATGESFRSKGFIPGASGNGWSWTAGPSAPGTKKHNEDALIEDGGGYWQKANPAGYKGQGADYIWYSPTQGYQTSQYIKQAPKEHGIGGFLKSPGGMMLLAALGAGIGGAGGLGGLFGEAAGAGAGGLSSLEGALGAAGGMSVAPGVATSGLLGSIGSLSPAISLVPGGAAMAGVASGALGSGGLFGNGGVFGSGLDVGKIGNSAIESGIKSAITSGGDVKKGLTSGLSSGLSGGLGSLFEGDAGRYIANMGRGALQSGLSGGTLQDTLKGALFGGANQGLKSFLNTTDLVGGSNNDKGALANNVTSLAQTLSRKRRMT